VFRAKDTETGKVVALKQVKMSREMAKEGFPITALREINIMLAIKHPNIVGEEMLQVHTN
jgi:cell division cycle 2-like protein